MLEVGQILLVVIASAMMVYVAVSDVCFVMQMRGDFTEEDLEETHAEAVVYNDGRLAIGSCSDNG